MRRAFNLGFLLFLVTIAIDILLIAQGAPILGIFSLLQSILVFSVGIIWLIRQDDQALHIKNKFAVVPLTVFGVALIKTLDQDSIGYMRTSESIQEIGNLMLSRYQVVLWFTAAILMLAFILAGSLMMRSRQ